MSRALLLAALIGCKSDVGEDCKYSFKCKSGICAQGVCQSGELGAACEGDFQCETPDATCLGNVCKPKPHEGERCTSSCVASRCFEGTCMAEVAIAKLEQQRKAKEEQRLLAESGIKEAPAAVIEAPATTTGPRPPGAGAQVRVAKTVATQSGFAACRTDERLIGGGCEVEKPGFRRALASSYPSGHSEQDTVGARWNCEAEARFEVTAYALCEKLPP